MSESTKDTIKLLLKLSSIVDYFEQCVLAHRYLHRYLRKQHYQSIRRILDEFFPVIRRALQHEIATKLYIIIGKDKVRGVEQISFKTIIKHLSVKSRSTFEDEFSEIQKRYKNLISILCDQRNNQSSHYNSRDLGRANISFNKQEKLIQELQKLIKDIGKTLDRGFIGESQMQKQVKFFMRTLKLGHDTRVRRKMKEYRRKIKKYRTTVHNNSQI
jgi:hypothetical protein